MLLLHEMIKGLSFQLYYLMSVFLKDNREILIISKVDLRRGENKRICQICRNGVGICKQM